ncbi:MAG: tRNA 2-thiouridine(34) synthase MnmA [Flavobacteriia bacterium]|nr:tRNA 2-thiouridine(34) synthase MnmA [Flavobacteriia bacterium]
MKQRVVVGMSGGVDSSVAAYLLKEQGYEVVGMFMKNWHDESVTLSDECPWIEDSNDAMLVAEQLEIPFHVIDLSTDYKNRIVDYMFAEYQAGRTPNPDVLCNREIKFDVFLKAAKNLGAEFVATGHYCRKKVDSHGFFHLFSGLDKNKDQSYFLCQLNQYQLSKALFPIGELQKNEVRAIAEKENLVTAQKKDSQGLCFVGKISLPLFLQQKLKIKVGKVIEIPSDHNLLLAYSQIPVDLSNVHKLSNRFQFVENDGIEVTQHQGAHFYTIGQRKGLHIGGRPLPSFVIETDINQNIVYSGQGENHPALNKWALRIKKNDVHWIIPDNTIKENETLEVYCRIRYRQALQKATLFLNSDFLYVLFKEKQKGVSPGQFACFYLDEELIGSGIIES